MTKEERREYNREYRLKIKADPERLAKSRQYAREHKRRRYRDDPEFRQREKQRTAEYHKKAEYKERQRPRRREYMRRYRANKKAVSTLTSIGGIIDNLIRKAERQQADAVTAAFQEHFGFPIHEVQDVEELEHIVTVGEPIESYRYRGETFLYWSGPEVFYEKTENGWKMELKSKEKRV